jgi:hypothetical protein
MLPPVALPSSLNRMAPAGAAGFAGDRGHRDACRERQRNRMLVADADAMGRKIDH